VAVFALANWTAFTAPTLLSLGFLEFQAPLGLVMLVLTGALSAGLLLVYIVVQQAGVILEGRRLCQGPERAPGTGRPGRGVALHRAEERFWKPSCGGSRRRTRRARGNWALASSSWSNSLKPVRQS
jgi:hypothetical protein